MTIFRDRIDAGERLAERLDLLRARDVIVLGLPRGGVPVAGVVAERLDAPLDVVVIRKLGAPWNPEYALGAIGDDDVRVIDETAMGLLGVKPDEVGEIENAERTELARRAERFRHGKARLDLTGRTAAIIDDGIATGATMLAACEVVRRLGAAEVIAAAPVAPADVVERLEGAADATVVLETPEPFFAVGQFYYDFTQTTDEEVVEWLERLSR